MIEDYWDKFKYVIFYFIFFINKFKDLRDYYLIDWMFNVNYCYIGYLIKEFLEFNLLKKYGYLVCMGDLDEYEVFVVVWLKLIDVLWYILNVELFKNFKYYYLYDRDFEENFIFKIELIWEVIYYLN